MLEFLRKYVVRQYVDDDSFKNLSNSPPWVKEIQVALAFARDYDENGKPTNGKYKPYWDQEKVNPSVISQFKHQHFPFQVKFLVSIGERDEKYSFSIANKATWIKNATQTLGDIVREYHLDGIDVYYEHISSHEFADVVAELIAKLKKDGVITTASMAPSAPVNVIHYHPLYQKCNDHIDTVVYQCHNELNPITDIGGLLELFHERVAKFYPREKLLSGYSTEYKDKVPAHLYFRSTAALLVMDVVRGTSIWTVRAPLPLFALQWSLNLLVSYLTKLPPRSLL